MNFREYMEAQEEDAAGVIVFYGDEALILQRGPTAPWMPNKWNLPGGGIDPNETPYIAAIRECREEAGIVPQNVRSLRSFPGFHVFVGITNSAKVRINKESQRYQWVDSQSLMKYDFVPYVREALGLAFKANETVVVPIQTDPGKYASRVLLAAAKNGNFPLGKVLPGNPLRTIHVGRD